MKKLSIVSAAGAVGLAAMAFQTANADVLTGSVANNANTCPWAILNINNDDCTYNGSHAAAQSTYYGADPWIGPQRSSAFYNSSIGTGSPQPGDGKVSPDVTVNMSIGVGNEISGTITIGAVAIHNFSAGGTTGRGEETWSSRTLTLTPKVADSVDGNTLIIGSAGFPDYLQPNLANAGGDQFPSETAADSNCTVVTGMGCTVADVPYWAAPSSIGIATWEDASVIGSGTGVASIGTTAAQMSTGYSCVDTNLGTGGVGGACASTSALENRGDFENVLLKVQTDGSGNITGVEGFLVQEVESRAGGGRKTWVAWTFNANTVVPVPAAVWLFGSALGMLGWARRRAAVTG